MTDEPMRDRWRRTLAIVVCGSSLLGLLGASRIVCLTALPHGVLTNRCPAGDLVKRLVFEGHELQRGAAGSVTVGVNAWFTSGPSDVGSIAPARVRSVDLTLVTVAGEEHALSAADGWTDNGHRARARVTLPADVPDGEHTLRVRVQTWGETITEELPLPLYAPARVDVLSDRPLYEPGDELHVRAVTVRAADLMPLDGRPGLWTLTDPEGTVVVEQRSTADEWGVSTGAFALDPQAASGPWTVRWHTGENQGAITVQVEPFTLPRFQVTAHADRSWFAAGDSPGIAGGVTYANGAPVAAAAVSLRWRFHGEWQPPRSWTEDALPAATQTDAAGRFRLELPEIPADLIGNVDVEVELVATDPAGERVRGRAQLRFAEDPIQVEAVTEFGDGLVEGFNNRVYLRTTTPDGTALPDTTLRVTRAWDPGDAGAEARTDADGVAALQLDPGPPVSVPLPMAPSRPPPPLPTVVRSVARLLGEAGTGISLADATSLDAAEPALEQCAELSTDSEIEVAVAVRLDAAGRAEDVVAPANDLGRCAAAAVARAAWSPGSRRTLQAVWRLRTPDRPDVSVQLSGAPTVDATLRAAIGRAARKARSCLPDTTQSGEAGLVLEWRTWADARARLEVLLGEDPGVLPAAVRTCVAIKLARAADRIRPETTAMGTARVSVSAAPSASPPPRAAPEVIDGYPLRVEALRAGEVLGATTIRLRPGRIPDLRLRMEPVIATPGSTVAMTVLRGPGFSGELPDAVQLRQPGGEAIEAELDPAERTATFILPADARGWYAVEVAGARSLIWVPSASGLDITLTSDEAIYRPGDTATLTVQTNAGGAGVAASVGLFGVDATLSQLTALPDTDSLDDLRQEVATPNPAFGVLDAQGLARGRIQGANAAAAVLLRVGALPQPATVDGRVSISAPGEFDPVPPLVDAFYTVLTELHKQTRAWEAAAPADEQMAPATMARLWGRAQQACADRGEPAADGWGRPLQLSHLPSDLLALTDPRLVVLDGTRLPEDVENWSAWVTEAQP